MTTVATLDTVMRLNSTAFRTGMVEAAAQANRSLGAIRAEAQATAGVLTALENAAKSFGGLYLVKEGLGSLVEAQVQMQQIHYTLQSATGSATDAATAFDFLKQTTAQLGLNLQPAAQGFGQLAAAAEASGIPLSQAEKLFTSFAQASTTMHLSSEQSQHALLALTEMMSRGTIQARQLNQQLGFAIPGSAARFKAAVMEAVQGTELAGKSFAQLEKDGDLVTARFLPQLTQALAESGRGWQDAAEGLNAQINRLKTAWFDLKNDLSGGLFNDVATSGVAFMAANLQHIATTLAVISGGALARVVGTQLGNGADKVGRYAQEYRGAQMAAGAEAEYAAATLAKVQADALDAAGAQGRAERTLATVRAYELQAQAARDAAAAEFEKQAAVDLAARQNVARLSNAMTLPANIKFQNNASAEAVAAQAALTKAQREYTLAVEASNAAGLQTDALNTKLIESNIALAAAENDVAAAEARVAAARALETEVGSLSTAIRGAAASFGNFALGLVGGPWGLAVAAVGGLAYAFYEVKKASEEYEAETVSQVKSLEALRAEITGATDDLASLHSKMNVSQGLDLFVTSGASLSKTRGELNDLYAQAQQLQDGLDRRAQNPTAGTAILDFLDQRKLTDVQTRIAALQQTMNGAGEDMAGLGDHLNLFVPAVDAVRGALDRLKSGASLADIFNGLGADFQKGLSDLDKAKAQIDNSLAEIAAADKGWQKKMLTDGKSAVQIAGVYLQQGIDGINTQVKAGLKSGAEGAKAIADLRAEFSKPLTDAAGADAAEAAKKAANAAKHAAEEQAQAYQNLKNSQDGQLQSLNDQLAGEGKASAAQQTLNKMLAGGDEAFRRLSVSEKAESIAKQQNIVALTKQAEAQKQATKDAEAFAIVQDNLARISRESLRQHSDALDAIGQGSKETADATALRATQRQYDDLIYQAGKQKEKGVEHGGISGSEYDKEVAAYKTSLDEQLSADKAYFAQRDALQSDWTKGASAAFQNYIDGAANAAANAQTLFTNAFSSMENALVNFVTTGKLDFKSLATSILTDLARIEIRVVESQILQAIIGAFMPSGGGAGSSLGGSGAAGYSTGSDGSFSGGFNFASTSGGRASGGPVAGGNLYEVAEGGKPELLTTGGKSYLLMGAQGGEVTPAGAGQAGSAGAGATSVVVNVSVVQNADGSTEAQSNTEALTQFGKQMGSEMEATARRVVSRALQPGGDIYKQTRMGAPA